MVNRRTYIYVDGFNVYYGIRYTPYRWLDLGRLARLTVPNTEISAIRYFTARIEARDDTDQPQRQAIYLRALQTIPNLSIHFGQFRSNQVRMALVNPPPIGAKTALVWKTEEKGSDVNLATYLLTDGFEARYEQAVVISNDSDLVEPIRVVRDKIGRQVIVLNPTPHFSAQIRDVSATYRKITGASLKAAQFPEQLTDQHGAFHRPAAWAKAKPK